MGADNFAQLPKWKDWQDIAARVPIAVIARPGDGLKPRLSKTAQMLADYRSARRTITHTAIFTAAAMDFSDATSK